jgi:hypothetical protein
LRAQLNSLLNIVKSVIKVLKLGMSNTPQEESLYRIFVNLNNFGTFFNSLNEVADAVEAH